MTYEDLAAPIATAVSLEAAKTFLRIDDEAEDALIIDLIDSATRRVEAHISASLVTRLQRCTTALPKGREVFLNRYPVTAITAVSADGEAVSFSANLKSRPAAIRLTSGQPWRTDYPGRKSVTVEFIAGYGETSDDIPTPLRQAVLLLVAQAYENRSGDGARLPLMADALLSPYRGVRL